MGRLSIKELESSGDVKSGVKISKKSRLVAFLLCYIFGMLGAHRFYVGKNYTAILYIFTFGLFGIGLIVDLLKIILGKFETPKGYVLKNWITED